MSITNPLTGSRNNRRTKPMTNEAEQELLSMLTEPTSEQVRKKVMAQDIAMARVGRALAPAVNKVLAELADKIEDQANDQ